MPSSRRSSVAGFEGELEAVLGELGLSVPEGARKRLVQHAAKLGQWNRRVNLTRIEDDRDVARRHFGESLFLWARLGLRDGSRVADIGSGAGFPGLPLAAVAPEADVTLVEPALKKAVFLREVCRDWGNVSVCEERVETYRRCCNWTVMRAVAAGPILHHLARIAPNAALLCGERTICEVRENEWFGWEEPIALPWGDRRYLLVGRRFT